VLALAHRFAGGALVGTAQRLAHLGYALPGPLLALGLFVPVAAGLAWLNERLGTEWAVGGSLVLLLLAYAVRFMAVAQTPLSAQLLRLSPQVDAQLRLLALPRARQLLRVHLPALAPASLTALLLVFVDVMKELPLTLLLRPFGWEPLAVRVFEHTREGQWQAAGAPALLIVLAGLLPVLLLARALRRAPPRAAA
jgi:iron(III) transport system permease protein